MLFVVVVDGKGTVGEIAAAGAAAIALYRSPPDMHEALFDVPAVGHSTVKPGELWIVEWTVGVGTEWGVAHASLLGMGFGDWRGGDGALFSRLYKLTTVGKGVLTHQKRFFRN